MIYLEKEREAKSFMLDPEPVQANYPMIYAEVGITAETDYQVAQLWMNMSVYWRTVSAQLESLRLSYCGLVDAATSVAQMKMIFDQFTSYVDSI